MVQPPRPTDVTPSEPRVERRDTVSPVQIRFRRALADGMRREWVTDLIIALNVAVFAWMLVRGVDPMSPTGAVLLQWGANYAPLTRGGEWWRLFTSVFVHGGLIHLGSNMYALLVAGRLVERIYGHAGYSLLYLFAGLLGSVASALRGGAPSIGASGAVFGVFGALLAFLLVRRALLPLEVLKRLRYAMLVTVVFNLGFGFSIGGIDNAAHLGGLAGGFLAGLVLAPSMDGEVLRRPWALYAAVPVASALVVWLIGFSSVLR